VGLHPAQAVIAIPKEEGGGRAMSTKKKSKRRFKYVIGPIVFETYPDDIVDCLLAMCSSDASDEFVGRWCRRIFSRFKEGT
jgi:hypothetical protein